MSQAEFATEACRSETMSGSAPATIVEFSGISIVPSAAVARIVRSLGRAPRIPLTPLPGLVGGAQSLCQRVQQPPADRAVLLHQRTEVPVREPPADELARRDNGCRACAFVDHRELAERVAGAEFGALLATHPDRRIATLDQEEGGTSRAFADHSLALREAARLEQPGDLLHLLVRQVREQRYLLDDLGWRARHQPARVTGLHWSR